MTVDRCIKVQITLSNSDPSNWYLTQLCADNTGVRRKNNMYTQNYPDPHSNKLGGTHACSNILKWPSKVKQMDTFSTPPSPQM